MKTGPNRSKSSEKSMNVQLQNGIFMALSRLINL